MKQKHLIAMRIKAGEGTVYFLLSCCFAATLASLTFAQTGSAASTGRKVTVTTAPNAVVWIDGIKFGNTSDDGTRRFQASLLADTFSAFDPMDLRRSQRRSRPRKAGG